LRFIGRLIFLRHHCCWQAVAFPSPTFAQIDAFQQQPQFPGGDFLPSRLGKRKLERASLEALVTHSRMQMLRAQQRALYGSHIRSIPSVDGSYLAWVSGTTAMG